MKKALLFLIALGAGASTFAGGFLDNGIPTVGAPDAGASALLLGLGVASVAFARKFKR